MAICFKTMCLLACLLGPNELDHCLTLPVAEGHFAQTLPILGPKRQMLPAMATKGKMLPLGKLKS